jgi:fructosamine-3-kinase
VSLPDAVRWEVEARLGPVRDARPVGGGCINRALRLELGNGRAFLKYNPEAPHGFFAAEARGLDALRAAAAGDLRVPEVLDFRDAEAAAGPAWLLLEWVEPGPRGAAFDERLGRGVAALHRRAAGGWGWEEDNFIGPLPQANAPAGRWGELWRDRRLEPRLRAARGAGYAPGAPAEWERLLDALPALLAPAEEDGPSLLHGDLWSGNVLAAAGGVPALVDPAAYRGHREVDLAMAELFGGFAPGFHAAYREARPLLPGYGEGRRAVYQLYYLLVHVELFGSGYVQQTRAALREALAAL